MKIIPQSWILVDVLHGNEILRKIEIVGRVSYKSEDLISTESAAKFTKMLIERGHESVLEHVSITVKVITDRGVSHELVRHRIASYTQESTRFCNYSKDKFNNELTFIRPILKTPVQKQLWLETMHKCEQTYLRLTELGASPQEARAVLPNSLKTELFITMNLRSWRHFFKLRTATNAHPQMQALAKGLLRSFKQVVPVIFDGIEL